MIRKNFFDKVRVFFANENSPLLQKTVNLTIKEVIDNRLNIFYKWSFLKEQEGNWLREEKKAESGRNNVTNS